MCINMVSMLSAPLIHEDSKPTEIAILLSCGWMLRRLHSTVGTRSTLKYRFHEPSFRHYFEDPDAAKATILRLFGEAIEALGESSPVRFQEDKDVSDFELVMMPSPQL